MKTCLAIAAALLSIAALVRTGVRNLDPYEQIDFHLQTLRGAEVRGVAVVPKLTGRYPVVVYLHANGENLRGDVTALRQIAELGLAAVAIEYDQADPAAFEDQFQALVLDLRRRAWALSNAVAWAGCGVGARCALAFTAAHPQNQPQLLVHVSGASALDLNSKIASTGQSSTPVIRVPVLLVDCQTDERVPPDAARKFAEVLRNAGTPVDFRIVPGQDHEWGDVRGEVLRAAAEYCRAHLPPADYTAGLNGCSANDEERRRFNLAMQRAGLNRRELWKAVAASRAEERHTLMTVIGGLEDYDLAHATAAHLKAVVRGAWRARRTYRWCSGTPLEIFEHVTANPRLCEEPIEDFQSAFSSSLRDDVKYCHTTQEVSDVVWRWMHKRVLWRDNVSGKRKTPMKILNDGVADCFGLAVLYSALCRSIGLAERPTEMVWQNPGLAHHYCTEVWSTEDRSWHELDSSSDNRTYNSPWLLRVPTAMILARPGERGGWDAFDSGRFDACVNNIGLFYPSGDVLVRVVRGGRPAPGGTICLQTVSSNGVGNSLEAPVDGRGELRFKLGASAGFAYRVFLDKPGDRPWQWLRVQTNQTHEVILDLDDEKPFDLRSALPPASGLVER